MKRIAVALAVVGIMLGAAEPAFANHLTPYVDARHAATEGAFCRWWTPAEEGGYWMFNDCAHTWTWYPEIYWADVEYYGVQWL